MSEMKEMVLSVPAELVRKCKGMGIDMGGSIVKFVYRTKEDQEEVARKDATTGHLHLVAFPKSELNDALQYVRERATISPNCVETPTLYTTGLGCTNYGRIICEKLGIKTRQVVEFDCFGKSFVYLASRLSRSELFEPFIEEATVEPIAHMASQMAVLQESRETNETQSIDFDMDAFHAGLEKASGRSASVGGQDADFAPLLEVEPDLFPCMLAVCGSGLFFLKIEKDGSLMLADGNNRGGRAFLGVGKLLTKCETYTELIELAARGNNHNVDVYSDENFDGNHSTDHEDQSFYKKTGKGTSSLIYCFGKPADTNHDDYNREDVARAWLNYCVLDLVQCIQGTCQKHGVTRLLFCGGFCDHPLVREIITTECVRRNLFQLGLPNPELMKFDFVRPGMYFGALGCIINDVEKFVGGDNY